MLKLVTKSHPLQLLLQARAIWVRALKVLGNQFAQAALVAVPGEDASGYQAAVQLWLDGSDDLEALRQLSGLANEGNTAAQALLARIGGHAHLISHVTEK